jgi:hypothetical protein
MDSFRIAKIVTAVSALALLSGHPVSTSAEEQDDEWQGTYSPDEGKGAYRYRVIHSVVATGLNDYLGKPVFDLGPPFGTFGFTMVGIYNRTGTAPIPISEDASDSDLLATTVHPNFLLIDGKTQADVNPAWLNIPLRNVPVHTDFDSIYSLTRTPLRGVRTAEPQEVAQAEPANPITLGQWKKGRGLLRIICQSKDSATLIMNVRSLLPNRIYGIGATLGGVRSLPLSQQVLAPFTIGGVPHLLVTDEHGDGAIERVIKFCPLDPESTNRTVLVMNLLYYSRHQNYGAVPEPVLVNGLWLGLVTHNHIQFPINVSPVGH